MMVILRILIFAVGVGMLPLGLSAQSSETQSGQSRGAPQANPPRMATPPIQILVSGCLRRGHDGGYYISDRNGITWALSSTTVDLSAQVMHAVTVTGKPAGLAQPPPQSSQPSGNAGSGGSSQHALQVLTLKMLSQQLHAMSFVARRIRRACDVVSQPDQGCRNQTA